MWEGWRCNQNSEGAKNYELMVKSNAEAQQPNVLLTVSITGVGLDPLVWEVRILSFAPSAGDYKLYEDRFLSIEEAEKNAWEKAQEILQGYPSS